jgi:adenosylhomocysteine nucleosidase
VHHYRKVARPRLRTGCDRSRVTRAAIIAALPGELKPLVRGWRHERRAVTANTFVDLWRWTFDQGEWVAACSGAGAAAGIRAFSAIEKDGPISMALSVGWAGALTENVVPGRAYRVSSVIDARTGERFETVKSDFHLGRKGAAMMGQPDRLVVTNPIVANEAEKRRLAATYRADLCDMEGAIVARLAAMRGIPFYCIKGVSDGLTDRLPDFNRFISSSGQIQLTRFILFALLRPVYWPALLRMSENSKKASQSIAESVRDFLDAQFADE